MSKNSFGKSLVSGILILAVSIAMLIGTTYAVFNDSSSTGVNTIQAGTLDVELVNSDGVSIVGGTVSFFALLADTGKTDSKLRVSLSSFRAYYPIISLFFLQIWLTRCIL